MSHIVDGCLAAEAAPGSSPLPSPSPPPGPISQPKGARRCNSPDPRFETTDAYELSHLATELAPPIGDDED